MNICKDPTDTSIHGKLKEQVYYIVRVEQYIGSIAQDGSLAVYENNAPQTQCFDTENAAKNAVNAHLKNLMEFYGVKNLQEKIVCDQSQIKENDFGFVKTECNDCTTYNMYDTRGEYPCEFIDISIQRKVFYCARQSNKRQSSAKEDFDVDYFFKDERREQEISEAKATLDEFDKLLRGE